MFFHPHGLFKPIRAKLFKMRISSSASESSHLLTQTIGKHPSNKLHVDGLVLLSQTKNGPNRRLVFLINYFQEEWLKGTTLKLNHYFLR